MSQARDKNGTRAQQSTAFDQFEGRNAVVSRLPRAFVRAVLVAILVVLPSIFLTNATSEGAEIMALVAIFAALFTLVEYSAAAPSIIEFRDAPPYNRLRFGALFLTIVVLSLMVSGETANTNVGRLAHLVAERIGASVDFPYSPVRLVLLMMPAGTDDLTLRLLRTAAGLAYVISLLAIVAFVILLRLQRWPNRRGVFNVWVNLPTFDPTAGGDVVARLNRDSQVNIILGFLLPFLIPAVVKVMSLFAMPLTLDDPQTMIWMVTAWAFLPASMLMRGVALSRIAFMIQRQRKQAYDRAVADGMLPV